MSDLGERKLIVWDKETRAKCSSLQQKLLKLLVDDRGSSYATKAFLKTATVDSERSYREFDNRRRKDNKVK